MPDSMKVISAQFNNIMTLVMYIKKKYGVPVQQLLFITGYLIEVE